MRTLTRCTQAAIAVAILPIILHGQTISCTATRSTDGGFRGRCMEADSVVGDVTLRAPAAASSHLWAGTIQGSRFRTGVTGGPNGQSEVSIDTRPGGTVRLGRAWLHRDRLQIDSSSIAFAFQPSRAEPPSEVDVEILHRALVFLTSESRWNRGDTTNMAAAPTAGFGCAPAAKQSVFCAAYLASLEVAGDYAHFRPAMNALRQAIGKASKRGYAHPLVDYNNDPATSLEDVKNVLTSAINALKNDLGRGGA